jgi:cyanophycinase
MFMPKGTLIAIGGAEDKGNEALLEDKQTNAFFKPLSILKEVVEASGGPQAKIEVITTASMIPDEVGKNYEDAFALLGVDVKIIKIRNREDALQKKYVQRIENCTGVMFSGGNQMRLSSIYGGTDFLKVLHRKYEQDNFVIAGTSAGAMAMSQAMIYEGNAATAHLKGEVKITSGLAFLPEVIVDSHFEKRGRFGRLAQAVAGNPGMLGMGLSEDTGVIIKKGKHAQVIGSGYVVFIDGRNIHYNNIAQIEAGTTIGVENLQVHLAHAGNAFNLKEFKFIDVEEVVS